MEKPEDAKTTDDAINVIDSNPNSKLAAQIATLLCKDGLLPENKKKEFEAKVAEGKATAEDWRTWIELGMPQDAHPVGVKHV